jgi:hypothetical protein
MRGPLGRGMQVNLTLLAIVAWADKETDGALHGRGVVGSDSGRGGES